MKGKDLTDRVYRDIKKDLMMKKIPSGELFSEQNLADWYHCSRTPAREAAGRLASEKFLNKYPSRGYIVRLPTEQEMYEMRYVCYSLEKSALELAYHNAYREQYKALLELLAQENTDPEILYFSNMTFHYELTKLSGNTVLLEEVERLHSLMIRGESQPTFRGTTFLGEALSSSMPPVTLPSNEKQRENHKKILEAMLEKDLGRAGKLLCVDFYPDLTPEIVRDND